MYDLTDGKSSAQVKSNGSEYFGFIKASAFKKVTK